MLRPRVLAVVLSNLGLQYDRLCLITSKCNRRPSGVSASGHKRPKSGQSTELAQVRYMVNHNTALIALCVDSVDVLATHIRQLLVC